MHHETQITGVQYCLHLGQDVQVQSFPKQGHIEPEQSMTGSLLTAAHKTTARHMQVNITHNRYSISLSKVCWQWHLSKKKLHLFSISPLRIQVSQSKTNDYLQLWLVKHINKQQLQKEHINYTTHEKQTQKYRKQNYHLKNKTLRTFNPPTLRTFGEHSTWGTKKLKADLLNSVEIKGIDPVM